MPRDNEAVKRLQAAMALGFSLPEAVQKSLGQTLTSWAEEHGYRQSEVSMCLGGYPGRIYGSIRDDLSAALGLEREDLDFLIDGEKPAAEPVSEEVA